MSQTFDPARLTARFKKGPASFKIEVLRGSARSVGVYPDPGSESKLLWSPPELSKPRTIDVTNQNHTFALEAGHDYIIRLPSTPLTAKHGLVLIGGRNVVIIGGEIRQDDPISPLPVSTRPTGSRSTGRPGRFTSRACGFTGGASGRQSSSLI